MSMAPPERGDNRSRSRTDQLVRLIDDAGAALTAGVALIPSCVGLVVLALVPRASRSEVATAAFVTSGTLGGTYTGVRVGAFAARLIKSLHLGRRPAECTHA